MRRFSVFLVYAFFLGSATPSAWGAESTWYGRPTARLADFGTFGSSCAIRYEIDASTFLCLEVGAWRAALNDEHWGCAATWYGKWKEIRSLGSSAAEMRTRKFFVARRWVSENCRSGVFQKGLAQIESLRWRWSIALAPGDSFGIFRHLLLSQRSSALGAVPWRELGFVHLLTATGIHLYALAGAVDAVLGRVFAPWGRVAWAKSASRVVALIVWVGLWLMSGARAGLLRPGWVVLLRWGFSWSGHRLRRYSALTVAMLVDVACALLLPGIDERWEEFALGRWHYLLAVGGGLVGAGLARNLPGWKQHFAMAVVSWLAVVPLEILEHGAVAPLTPLLSVLSIPLMAQVALPGLLLGLSLNWHGGVTFLVNGVNALLSWMVDGVRALDGVWLISPQQGLVGATCASFLFLKLIPWRLALAGLTIACAMVRIQPSTARLVQWNAAQGDVAIARFADGRSWILDAGSAAVWKPGRWFQKLAKQGVGRIDRVVLSHWDEDHRGGLAALAAWVRIDGAIVRQELLAKARAQYPVLNWTTPPAAPEGWVWFQPKEIRQANGVMLGWAWMIGEKLYLNLGDAPEKAERSLEVELRRYGAIPWVWKLSHHGSRTSTPEDWFRKFDVREAWVSAGHANQHGHPHTQVLRKIPRSVKIRSTSEEGDLVLEK